MTTWNPQRGGESALVYAASGAKHVPASHPLVRKQIETGESCRIVRILSNVAPACCEVPSCRRRQASTHILYRYAEFAWRPVGGYRCDEHQVTA
jgi:hypothetical protein